MNAVKVSFTASGILFWRNIGLVYLAYLTAFCCSYINSLLKPYDQKLRG